MIRNSSSFIFLLTLLVDTFFIIFSYLFSFWFRFYSGFLPVTKGIPSFQDYLISLVFLVFVYLITFHLLHLYKKEKIFEEYYKLFKATLFVFFVFVTFTFIQREISYSRVFIAVSFVFSLLFASCGRFFVNLLKSFFYKKKRLLTRAILISNERDAKILSNKITFREGYYIVKTLDLNKLKQLSSLLSFSSVDEIIIHLPKEDQRKILQIMELGGHDISYKIIPNIPDLITKRALPSSIGTVSVLQLQETPLKDLNAVAKRLLDFFLSSLLILLFLPLFFLLTLLIKFTSRGPIFYTQERVSYNNKPFILYKFRTMIEHAEQYTGPKWADDRDPRVTRIGKFLRITNLDELPQLFNVLKGDMSLVGPRPERPFFIQQFKEKIPRYLQRHAVKGGMTGWAQVNGFYGNTSLEERIKYDLFYLENWSFFFDIKIILKTLKLFFKK